MIDDIQNMRVGNVLAKQWMGAITNPGYYFFLANALGRAAVTAGNAPTKVYRVYGGDSKAAGYSWTPINPNKVNNYRDADGLPSGMGSGATNTGQYIIEGRILNKHIMESRPAYPLDGNRGGLREYIIDPTKVTIERVSGVNPPF